MTATDKLRNLLDGRGVEWTANESEYCKETCWTYMCELTAAFAEYNDGTIRFDCDTWCFTPEQAIEATLGGNGMKHVFVDYEGNELCIMDDGGYEAVNYIRELDGYIADVTASKDDITAEDEARIFAMSYAVQCSLNTLCKAIGVKLSKFDIISGHFTS